MEYSKSILPMFMYKGLFEKFVELFVSIFYTKNTLIRSYLYSIPDNIYLITES
jgi:hypothetical protein